MEMATAAIHLFSYHSMGLEVGRYSLVAAVVQVHLKEVGGCESDAAFHKCVWVVAAACLRFRRSGGGRGRPLLYLVYESST